MDPVVGVTAPPLSSGTWFMVVVKDQEWSSVGEPSSMPSLSPSSRFPAMSFMVATKVAV